MTEMDVEDQEDIIYARFERLAKLGEGTYGVVFKARERATNRIVALKRIRTDGEDEGVPSTAIREIATLRELHHPNVVDLIDVVNTGLKLYLVFEYMDSDLKHYLDHIPTPFVDPLLAKSYMYQILRGLEFCHARRTLHRDMKPQNLLIDSHGAIKLADFGLARAFCIPLRAYTHEVITLWYRAPEILLGSQHYSVGVDMWSLGTIFAELLTKQPLFPGDSEIDQMYKIFRVLGTPHEAVWPGVSQLPDYKSTFPQWSAQPLRTALPNVDPVALDLMAMMLVYDPARRISARQAMDHQYFDELDKTLFSS